MKPLSTILPAFANRVHGGPADTPVAGVALDSRQVVEGGLFAAIPGYYADGHNHILDALSKGATVVVYSNPATQLPEGVIGVQVADPAQALASMAHNYYDRPSEELEVIGVTGTNGKTSACSFLYQLFRNAGFKTGLIATTHILIDDEEQQATHTTPDAITMARLLRQMADQKVTHVFVETSSHALVQQRVAALTFRGGIFTNITHEHLDYHGTFQAYIEAKQTLFRLLPRDAFALTNKDDRRSMVMVQDTAATVRTYALQTMADYQARVIEQDMNGMQLRIQDEPVYTKLIGSFNAYNVLLAYAAGVELGLPSKPLLEGLSLLKPPTGRMELLHGKSGLTGIVDYAHSTDALKHVLTTITQANKHQGSLIVVLGCGGDRDKAKRPEMLKTSLTYADQVIITADNPRSEEPEAIAQDMRQGATDEDAHRLLTILDREAAIQAAVKMAPKDGIILVAGKGHEKFQEVKGTYLPFDDKSVLAEAMQAPFSTPKSSR